MGSATVVLYPSPEIGHLVSMVELGKLIHTHHPSLSIVILITPSPSKTGSTSTGKYIDTISDTTTFITFHHLPTVALPPELSSHDFVDRSFEIPQLYNPIVHDTLLAIADKSTIKSVILDFFTNDAFQVSKTLNLPTYYFFTGGASGLCSFLYLPTIHNTISDEKDPNIYFDIPGVPTIHASDMPIISFDRESNSYKNFINTAGNMAKSSGIIVNSFVGFEESAVETLLDGKCIPDRPTPPVYLVGPLIVGGNPVNATENDQLKWLNSQPSKSVVFLCFGSRGVFKTEQLKEIAIGLEKSGQRFLWVVRDTSPADENEWSSSGKYVSNRIGDKGMVVKNWAPQTAILNHDSVGGFVSHCGWNSTLEAVVAGVPMVAWPLYAEQKLNKVVLVERMKVALAVKMSPEGFVMAEAVEETVRELMEGVEGRVVRERILEMSRRGKAAAHLRLTSVS